MQLAHRSLDAICSYCSSKQHSISYAEFKTSDDKKLIYCITFKLCDLNLAFVSLVSLRCFVRHTETSTAPVYSIMKIANLPVVCVLGHMKSEGVFSFEKCGLIL